ncbi:MAG TPA: hypothetical protein VJT73_19810 [Polyangiaceae bacterium]|nr:hypothetical protein [Polyangiaceae bacterium]
MTVGRVRRDRHRLRRRLHLAAVALGAGVIAPFGASSPPAAFAEGGSNSPWLVVVHPDNPVSSAAREFVVDAFLKSATRWDGGEMIRPVDLRADSLTRRAFSESILKRSVAAVRSYWQQRIFSGRDVPPPELESEDAVVDYVLKHRGGVGYVSGAAKTREAKVLIVR